MIRKIFIVDDHPLIRRGLRQLFEAETALSICGEAGSVDDALAELRRQSVDLVIIDISLPDGSGFDLIKRLRMSQPALPILVCSMHEERFFAERALRTGARGYVSKLEAPEHLIDAVQAVLQGKYYVRKALTERELQKYLGTYAIEGPNSPVDLLSNRELEVFEQIGAGNSTAQIAKHLNLSVKTIESHRLHIRQKLKLANATEVARHALYWAMRDMTDYVGDK